MRSGRAATLVRPRRFEVVPAAPADPEPGQVTVDVAGCGVCGSNLPVWEGRPWFEYPLRPGAPGHEAWGTVREVHDAGGVRVGDAVAFLAEAAFADTVHVPADRLVVLPAELRGVDFPGRAARLRINVAARSGFAAGQTVAVIGVGFLGAIVTRLAVARRRARHRRVSRRADALDVARGFGAAETLVDDGGSAVVERIAELTGGELCDVVVEAAGVQRTLDVAGQLTRTARAARRSPATTRTACAASTCSCGTGGGST